MSRLQGWVSRVLRYVDDWYRRRFDLRPAGPVLFIGQQIYRGAPRKFADGTCLTPGQSIGVLHFNNARIARLDAASRQTVGVRFARLFRQSLAELARLATLDPDLKHLEVYHGVTWLAAHGRKVGFVSEALPPGWRRRWLTAHFRLLAFGFAPPVVRRGRVEPRHFWITRGALVTYFGARNHADT